MLDLYRMRCLLNRLPTAEINVAEAVARATKTTTTLTGMPRGSGTSDQTGDGAIMLTIAKDALDKIQEELAAMRAELVPLIERLEDPTLKKAITSRYIEGMSVREVACSMSYSGSQIYRKLKQAELLISAM